MPIDPNIALSYKPPQVENPLQQFGNLLALKNEQQQMQAGQVELQQRQLQLKQTKALNDAYRSAIVSNPDGTSDIDTNRLTSALSASGAGAAIPKVLEGVNAYKKGIADLQESQGKVAQLHADNGGAMGAAIKEAGYDPHLFMTLTQLGIQQHAIDPQQAAPYLQKVHDVLQQDPAAAKELVQKIADTWIKLSPKQQELSNAAVTAAARQTEADTREKRLNAEMRGIQLDAERKQQEVSGTKPIQPAEQAQIAATQAQRAETARHNKIEEGQGAQRVSIAGGELGVARANSARQQKQFDATYGALVGPDGKPLQPEAAKAIAEQDPAAAAIANYQLGPPTMSRGGQAASIMRKVLAINPGYDQKNWQAQAAMMKAYTSGQPSKEISGINTALAHVGTLGDAIDALKNGNIQLLNRIANAYQVQTGGDAVTTFRAIVHKVAPEINRAYVGGVGAQGEILTQESDFDPKLGDQQLRSNTGITAKLLRSKIGSMENQWNQTMGSDFEKRFLMPEAKQAMDRWGAVPKGGGAANMPAIPSSIPQAARSTVHYSPSTKLFYYSSDQGKTWQTAQP